MSTPRVGSWSGERLAGPDQPRDAGARGRPHPGGRDRRAGARGRARASGRDRLPRDARPSQGCRPSENDDEPADGALDGTHDAPGDAANCSSQRATNSSLWRPGCGAVWCGAHRNGGSYGERTTVTRCMAGEGSVPRTTGGRSSSPPPQFERKADRIERERRAKAICADCIVRYRVPRVLRVDQGAARHLGRPERARTPCADRGLASEDPLRRGAHRRIGRQPPERLRGGSSPPAAPLTAAVGP